ncbi:hypothetical protein [Dyadobacter aurulentus]|uniref:hypothetical protein n=1 Tax=Dyadobacter sp. UC 10 TaxID=2605428 RepID=UPI0011F3612D|nr:hypothetical protein [Dyadobacter sp. UC 10]KAA0988941.1 hypothetical protein FXO21_01570 [Dyadobacter sp. UC 10]
MKRIVPIGLLSLLLYHMLGLSMAVLCFEKDYQVAALSGQHGDRKLIKMYHPNLPYSPEVQLSEEINGLIRSENHFYNPVQVRHANDTLYITLESNQGARDRFAELAGAMEMLSDTSSEMPQSPYSKALKLFGSLFNSYLPAGGFTHFQLTFGSFPTNIKQYRLLNPGIYISYNSPLSTPPPEVC